MSLRSLLALHQRDNLWRDAGYFLASATAMGRSRGFLRSAFGRARRRVQANVLHAAAMRLALHSAMLAAEGFAHGFSLRSAAGRAPVDLSAYSAVAGLELQLDRAALATAEAFAGSVGFELERLYSARQVHGTRVLHVERDVDSPAACRGQEADGLLAGPPLGELAAGLAVAVVSADCVPLVLSDPRSGAVAAVHAGWRGLVAGVALAALTAMQAEYGARPAEVRVAMFPHIRACCFEIGWEVASPLRAISRKAVIERSGARRPFGAMAEALRAQLVTAGVLPAHIDDVEGCTACDATRFVSFRRDGRGAGRHYTVAVSRGGNTGAAGTTVEDLR